MPISIGQWREEIGNFNSYKSKTSFKNEHNNFMVYLSLYKLIIIIWLCYIHSFINYCDCFPANILHYLLIILITDNFAIQTNNFLSLAVRVYKSFKTKLIRISYSLQYCLILNYLIELSLNLILQHGDIEPKPGTRGKHSQYLSFCHWNLNSLPAHNYAKLPLLQVFNTLHKFDLICLLETYLDSSILTEEKSLIIDGYKLLRADNSSEIPKKVEFAYIIKNLYLLKF